MSGVLKDPRTSCIGGSAEHALRSSLLLKRGGYQVLSGLFNRRSVRVMFDEAIRQYPYANQEWREGEDVEDWRGGLPPRRMLSAAGGLVQDRLYGSRSLAAYLSKLIGAPVQASSNRASYSYYCREGDHLAVHRDVEFCDISVILVVSDNPSADRPGGELVVYPERVNDPLSEVRKNPDQGAVVLTPSAGETVVIAGGMVPHLVRPIGPNHYRISAPMCFRVETPV